MENTMTTETQYIKKNQQLPQDIHDIFSEIISNDVRDQLIRELRQTGWTLESISLASKLTRERVRQISNTVPEAEFNVRDVIEIPEPPIKVEKPKPVYVEPSAETLARLLELQPYAQQVRSNGKKYREEAEEYTKLLNYAHTVEGVTLYRLAKRLGVTHGALRFRLVRYGYKQPVTATSKVYTPIVAENRLK
jgi:lambda repressor-like predicted transcriptional regulator